MNNLKNHIIYIAIIAILLLVLGIALSRPQKVVEVVKHKTDTTVVEKIDTLYITKVVEKEKVVTDTAYIVVNDTIRVPIPISTYRFFEKDLYDITAKGYNVSIESISVFPKTRYETITNTIEKEVVYNYWDFYLGLGLSHYNAEWIPSIAATVKAPKNFLFGANLGYYKKNIVVGGTVQYKITHNKR